MSSPSTWYCKNSFNSWSLWVIKGCLLLYHCSNMCSNSPGRHTEFLVKIHVLIATPWETFFESLISDHLWIAKCKRTNKPVGGNTNSREKLNLNKNLNNKGIFSIVHTDPNITLGFDTWIWWLFSLKTILYKCFLNLIMDSQRETKKKNSFQKWNIQLKNSTPLTSSRVDFLHSI